MSRTLNAVGAITLFVEDKQSAGEFYARVFELSPLFEDDNSVAFKLDNLIVNLLARSEADELIAPAPVGAPGDGSRFQLTIWVADADAACAELARRGVELLNGPLDRSWGVRTAAFADPDGHVWEVAAQIAA